MLDGENCTIMTLIKSDRVQITKERSAFATRTSDGSGTTECGKVLGVSWGRRQATREITSAVCR